MNEPREAAGKMRNPGSSKRKGEEDPKVSKTQMTRPESRRKELKMREEEEEVRSPLGIQRQDTKSKR